MLTATDTFLFHRPEFIFRDPEEMPLSFSAEGLQVYFKQIGNALISLDKSPFGSFVINKDISPADIKNLLVEIESWSRNHNVTNIVIRGFPELYQRHHHTLIDIALTEAGFTIRFNDTSQIIPVSAGHMQTNTHKKRRLRKGASIGFTVELAPIELLHESYQLIVESRANKGYPVTMTFQDLQRMFVLFPKAYLLFVVFDQKRIIATSVSIVVNSEILYCFYIGDDLAYRAYSPVTTLVNGIYEYCQKNGLKLLDLGISTNKGVLNKGLYNFKKTFGAVDSRKLTYLKQL